LARSTKTVEQHESGGRSGHQLMVTVTDWRSLPFSDLHHLNQLARHYERALFRLQHARGERDRIVESSAPCDR